MYDAFPLPLRTRWVSRAKTSDQQIVMKHTQTPRHALEVFVSLLLVSASNWLQASPAPVIFEDDFETGIPGWTAVQPTGGNYIEGPMLWAFDKTTDALSEQSNIYTDSSTFSLSRIGVMLINDTVAPSNFTYTARLTAGDDDGFGLIWGYQDEYTFYRAYFGRQARAGWPFQGTGVDRMNNGQITDLFGVGAGAGPGFVNTVGRPFDVTITVTDGLLTLTVVDDPLGTPTPYNLVTDAPLPTSGAGRVGIFSWGMSGNNPRAFRVQNPVLSPTPLAGNPSATVLTNWSFLITPRGDGNPPNVTAGGPPIWANGLGVDGNVGTMIENSDWTADNNAASTTNFAAPTAVAGDVNWSNYVYTARIISHDDDGFGMLLRYKNETNFYRIAFRRQNPPASGISSGVKQGISIQKNVDQVFDEVFSSAAFLPPVGVPIDVNAAIRDNRLQIVIIADPLSSSAQSYFFGPFDITGGTVDNGKIGVFSWAQNSGAGDPSNAGTEVDFVKVQELTGEGLLVSSAFGTPIPQSGLNDFPANTMITSSVPSQVMSELGVRRICTGWTGAGSVPVSGSGNEISFTLSTFSSIIWNWQTEYLLSTSATAGGTVTASGGPWVPEGTNVTVTAQSNPGYIFIGWSGGNLSSGTNLSFAMNRPISVTANFAADSDADGMADSWEMKYFGNLAQAANGDPDSDGETNLSEFQLGSNPGFPEAIVATDGLSSQWVNTQRDPALPGQLFVADFGSGYRGAWDNSNDNRFGNDVTFIGDPTFVADGASFQSPIVVVRSNLWEESWGSNFVAQIEFTVGDNDGNCFYFRYKDELNWYRATLCGEDTDDPSRPVLGLSIQSRVNGKYASVPITVVSGDSFVSFTDPLDGTGTTGAAGFKRVRLTITATDSNFEAKVTGWNAFLSPADFDPNFEYVTTFSDTNHASGRIGFGFWGQGGFGSPNAINGIPVDTGGMADNILVSAGGSNVFTETWETASLTNEFPAGWTNPFSGDAAEGNWQVTAHGTIVQLSNFGAPTTGTVDDPKADGDGPILLAPPTGTTNYLLQIGFHPFDNDGIGFVYNYTDSSNYSRVMFVSEPTPNAGFPQGISVSRKVAGVWSDIVAGDSSFIYTQGRPFEIEFANNNGEFTLLARDTDNPEISSLSRWTEPAANAANRFGLACWSMQDAHFLYARALGLPNEAIAPSLRITGVSIINGNLVIDISKENVASYNVQRKASLNDEWITVATGQTGAQYSEPLSGQSAFYQLVAP